MITNDGHFLHIDFGHFLGNFKSKFGVRRERTPFVLTRAMVEVFGGEKDPRFGEFVSLCQRAFLILRKHATLLITCFTLMLSCGIPELRKRSDIFWLRDHLFLDKTEKEAAVELEKIIRKCLHSAAPRVNDAIHIAAH